MIETGAFTHLNEIIETLYFWFYFKVTYAVLHSLSIFKHHIVPVSKKEISFTFFIIGTPVIQDYYIFTKLNLL